MLLNKHGLLDDRVNIIIGDAFIEVEMLVNASVHYDAIIVDLPTQAILILISFIAVTSISV